MLDERALPATHVAIRRTGLDLVNSFVFQDGIAEAMGVAVVMTPAAARAALSLTDDIKKRSQALQKAKPSESCEPDKYTLVRQPLMMHAVSAVVADDSEVVLLGFRSVDFESTFVGDEGQGRLQVRTKVAAVVVLSASSFLGWIAMLTKMIASEEPDDDDA